MNQIIAVRERDTRNEGAVLGFELANLLLAAGRLDDLNKSAMYTDYWKQFLKESGL